MWIKERDMGATKRRGQGKKMLALGEKNFQKNEFFGPK